MYEKAITRRAFSRARGKHICHGVLRRARACSTSGAHHPKHVGATAFTDLDLAATNLLIGATPIIHQAADELGRRCQSQEASQHVHIYRLASQRRAQYTFTHQEGHEAERGPTARLTNKSLRVCWHVVLLRYLAT